MSMETQQETWPTIARLGMRVAMMICILVVIVLAVLAFIAELSVV